MKLFQALYNVSNFRTAFDFGGREVAHWFPGHMAKGLLKCYRLHLIRSSKYCKMYWLSHYWCVYRTQADQSQSEECGLHHRNT